MKRPRKENAGFTLIELMIVFVIIIVLAGMVLRLMGLAGTKNAEAVTRERLERVAQALEEFRSIYGRYPPVDYYPGNTQPMDYEFPIEGDRTMPSSIKSMILQRSQNDNNIWSADGSGRVFTFGLLSYFFPRYKSHAENSPEDFIGQRGTQYDPGYAINQWYDYNEANLEGEIGDIEQNIESARRILPYLGAALRADGSVEKYGIVEKHQARRKVNPDDPDDLFYVNLRLLIRDGWLRGIHYQSRPPYDSYRLWSSGADGKSGTDDDIVAGED